MAGGCLADPTRIRLVVYPVIVDSLQGDASAADFLP